jgi:4-aminobutyrate aminotransferase-like enzyme
MLVVSKSSGSGFPVSGVITTEEIADRIASRGWTHLASHQCDPLPAAAVAATIDIVRKENLVARAAETGCYFMDKLQQLKGKYSVVVDVRGIGLMLGMEIGNFRDGSELELCNLIVMQCENRGVHLTYTYYEPVIRFIPPLTLTKEEVDRAISVLDESIAAALEGKVSRDSVMPSNPYSRKFIQGTSVRKTFKRVATRFFETSPQYWLQKMKEAGGK